MKKCALLILLTPFIFSCGGETKEETKTPETCTIVFKPSAGEKKDMSFSLVCESASDSTNVTFSFDIAVQVTSGKNDENTLVTTYEKICAKGEMGKEKLSLCAGDTIPEEYRRLVGPVFEYWHSVFQVDFDNRMRKTGEQVKQIDSAVTLQAANTGKMQFFTVLPPENAKVGDTWEEELDLGTFNKKKAKLIYKLESVGKKTAVISFTGTMETSGDGQQGQEFRIKALSKGNITVDVRTGWTISAMRQEDITMAIGESESTGSFIYHMNLK